MNILNSSRVDLWQKPSEKNWKFLKILLVISKNIYKSKFCRWPHGHITGKLVLTDLRVYDTTVTAPYYLYSI